MCSRLLSWIRFLALASPAAWADHIAREDPPEPIFTERAFIENDLEIDAGVDRDRDGDTWEFGPSVTWIFFERLQLGAEFPVGWRIPDEGSRHVALSDIGLSSKWLFCCDRAMRFTFLSTRVDVAPPTGDRSEGIGGTGAFTFSLLGGYGHRGPPQRLSRNGRIFHRMGLRLVQPAVRPQFAYEDRL